MDGNMQTLRGEMQRVGQCLQAGIMAAPRAGANELGGSVDCVSPAVEDKLIRETCWVRVVTEKVTVTEREKLKGVTETCTRHIETREIMNEVTEITETRKMETVEERLHDKDGVKDEHTHTEVVEDHEGELEECLVTRCEQLDSLLQERRETLCSLEADHDQVDPVEFCEVEGTSAVDRCMRSLGGMEALEPLVVALIPSAIVPVCVVSRCVFTSVATCVLQRTHSGVKDEHTHTLR